MNLIEDALEKVIIKKNDKGVKIIAFTKDAGAVYRLSEKEISTYLKNIDIVNEAIREHLTEKPHD